MTLSKSKMQRFYNLFITPISILDTQHYSILFWFSRRNGFINNINQAICWLQNCSTTTVVVRSMSSADLAPAFILLILSKAHLSNKLWRKGTFSKSVIWTRKIWSKVLVNFWEWVNHYCLNSLKKSNRNNYIKNFENFPILTNF